MTRTPIRRVPLIRLLLVALLALGGLFAHVPGPAGATAVTKTFTNTADITIPDSGSASPYPSTIDVSNVCGTITKVTVTLDDFSHLWPEDVDILLVGPNGQTLMLMSDAGDDFSVQNVDLTFDDAATAALPNNAALASGTYKPTDYVTP